MTPSGIEPVTFRFVVQCLNQLCHRVPPTVLTGQKIIYHITALRDKDWYIHVVMLYMQQDLKYGLVVKEKKKHKYISNHFTCLLM